MGGACVLDDCVPSKTLIASAGVRVELGRAADLGFTVDRRRDGRRPRRGQRAASRAWPWRSRPTSAPASSARACGSSGARPVRRRAEPRAGCTRSRPATPTAAARSSPPTSSWSPPAPPRACSPTPSPTASGSSPGASSTTSPSCPSTWSSSAPASPARSSPPPTSRWARRSRWSPAATGCCPARTPTPPRCWRTCSPSAAWRSLAQARAESVRRDGDGVVVDARRRPHGRRARTR